MMFSIVLQYHIFFASSFSTLNCNRLALEVLGYSAAPTITHTCRIIHHKAISFSFPLSSICWPLHLQQFAIAVFFLPHIVHPFFVLLLLACLVVRRCDPPPRRYCLFIARQPASAPHMLRIVPHTVPRVGRSYEHFPDGFELHLLLER